MGIALCFDNDEAGREATERAAKMILEEEKKFWALKTSKSFEDRQLYWWHVVLWLEPNCFTDTFKAVDKLIQEEMDFRHWCESAEMDWRHNLDKYLRKLADVSHT